MDIIKSKLNSIKIIIFAIWAAIELPLVDFVTGSILWLKNALFAIIRQIFTGSGWD